MLSSLYVHFPFCETKCHYCDFYSLGRERTREGDPTKFENALRTEAGLWAERLAQGCENPEQPSEWETIFFGGGTPSMTPASSMKRALDPLWARVRPGSRTEWTMEANPSSVSRESLGEYRDLGVNRISMGVQALRDDLLARLGRVHSREKALGALDSIFAAGFDNVSVDLLCGVPGQSARDLDEAMTILTSYPITHLSCYLLTLPPHHRMYAELPDEDEQLAHLLFIDEFMRAKGFEHYEISNFSKPGKRARHNLAYWKGHSYLALGPSAHSFDAREEKRWKNVSSLHKYAELLECGELPIEWTETLSESQKTLEHWMLALRLDEGFPASWLESPSQRAKAAHLTQEGLIERHPRDGLRLRLTARGFTLSDQIVKTFVS